MEFIKKRAGFIFLAVSTKKILLILENNKWTVPTFIKENSIFKDAEIIFKEYNQGKIVPIELYVSNDKGFEFGTYVCKVSDEFLINSEQTYAWAALHSLPTNLHLGLKNTLTNSAIQTKLNTILSYVDDVNLVQQQP